MTLEEEYYRIACYRLSCIELLGSVRETKLPHSSWVGVVKKWQENLSFYEKKLAEYEKSHEYEPVKEFRKKNVELAKVLINSPYDKFLTYPSISLD